MGPRVHRSANPSTVTSLPKYVVGFLFLLLLPLMLSFLVVFFSQVNLGTDAVASGVYYGLRHVCAIIDGGVKVQMSLS